MLKEYLKQLEKIRKQNYRERQIIKGVNNGRASVEPPKADQNIIADPRVDPDARRKKIQELKVRFFTKILKYFNFTKYFNNTTFLFRI